MTLPFDKEQLKSLTSFLDSIKTDPSKLHHPDLAFLKLFVEHFGAKIPSPTDGSGPDRTNARKSADTAKESIPEPEPESEESDLELDTTGVVEPDTEAPQKMGNPTVVPTEEEIAESQAKRSEAVSAFVEKDYERAIALYTEAIVLNPRAALLFAKRGQVYLFVGKPNACIRDCDRALELNPDSAAAHKFRGRANQLLGRFEEAAADLRLACKFDFDEEADDWLRGVTPNARKIEEHKRKKERRSIEKAERERAAALKKAREEARAREANTRPSQTEGTASEGGAGAGAGAGGGAPGAAGFYQFLDDPEVLQAFRDPEVSQAFADVSSNPGNILKYRSNPKIMAFISKMATKFGGAGAGAGGMPDLSGMMGGVPGGGLFTGAAGASPDEPPSARSKPSAPSLDDDVGLD